MESEKSELLLENSTLSNMFQNSSENRINFLAQEILNSTWENISGILSDWQKSQLADMGTVSGIRCLLGMWLNYNLDELGEKVEGSYCNGTWDNVYCWPPTPPGTNISQPCAIAFQETQPDYAGFLQGHAYRACQKNGTWSQGFRTNYDECANSYEEYELNTTRNRQLVILVQYMVFIGSILSLICLGSALATFYYFKSLRSDRIKVHVHLMLALVLRFILLLIITEPFVMNRSTSYRDIGILCKALIAIYLFATVASVCWMLVQGMYLNSILATNVLNSASSPVFCLYYGIGWVLPALLITIYLSTMLTNDHPEECWRGYADMNEIWILLVPLILALMLNAVFLCNILRVVVEKSKSPNLQTDTSSFMSAAKATLILFPVLGINNLLLLYNPGGEYEKYYVALNTFFGSTQGIFVSIVYCFNSTEVHNAIRRSYNRFTARRSIGMMARANPQNRASFPMTAMSELSPQQEQSPEQNTSQQTV